MSKRMAVLVLILAAGVWGVVRAQNGGPAKAGPAANTGDYELVERLLVARRNYQATLEQLRAHYIKVGNLENAKWVQEEIKGFHLVPQHAYRLELEVPPPNLQVGPNVVEANKLYTEAMQYKDKGWGNDFIWNQHRAEILFQKILTQYPQSNKISDVAYQLGDIYESRAYRQYKRSAVYFERCVQWNPQTTLDARLRAARLYDRQLKERSEAIRLYRDVTTHETDTRRIQEATKRLAELSGTR